MPPKDKTQTRSNTDDKTPLTNQNQKAANPPPKKGCFLMTLEFISHDTVLAAAAVSVSQIIDLIYTNLSYIDFVIRIYVFALTFPIVLVQLGWTKTMKESLISKKWTVRGLFYIFIGVLVLQSHDGEAWSDSTAVAIVFCCAYAMILSGLLYFVLGILCLKKVYEAKLAAYNESLAEHKAKQNSSSNV